MWILPSGMTLMSAFLRSRECKQATSKMDWSYSRSIPWFPEEEKNKRPHCVRPFFLSLCLHQTLSNPERLKMYKVSWMSINNCVWTFLWRQPNVCLKHWEKWSVFRKRRSKPEIFIFRHNCERMWCFPAKACNLSRMTLLIFLIIYCISYALKWTCTFLTCLFRLLFNVMFQVWRCFYVNWGLF